MNVDGPFSTTAGSLSGDGHGERPEIPGFTILDDRPMGEGGMGIVWRARQHEPDRLVAIKVLKHWQPRRVNMERAHAEATTLASLQHPNIVTLLEFGWFESRNGRQPFFVMPVIDGVALDKYVEKTQPNINARIHLLRQILDAIASAHSSPKPIVHRDLKPSNIMVDLSGRAVILDFGIADFLDSEGLSTQARAVTMSYASPEQAQEFWDYRGSLAAGTVQREARSTDESLIQSTSHLISGVGKPSDVYSLGVVAFQLFDPHGRRPYQETESSWDTQESTLGTLRRRPLPRPALASRKLARVIAKSLSVDVKDRYTDAQALAGDVRRAVDGDVTQADNRRNPLTWINSYVTVHRIPLIIALVLFVGTVGIGWEAFQVNRQRQVANALAKSEREARLRAASQAQSTDEAVSFLDHVLFSVDTYSAGDKSVNWSNVVRAANDQLPSLQNDPRAAAIVLKAMGRIASNWGEHKQGVIWLNQSVDLWSKIPDNDPDMGMEAARHKKNEEAEAWNWLAWALTTDHRQKDAVVAAQRAYVIERNATSAVNDDALAYRFDWAKMQINSGDVNGGINQYVGTLAEANGRQSTEYMGWLVKENREIAHLAAEGKSQAARDRLLADIRPFLDPSRPRFRDRLPWSLAQAGEFMMNDSQPLHFFFVLDGRQLGISSDSVPTAETLQATGRIAIDVAVTLSKDLPPSHPDIQNVQKLYDRVVGGNRE